jgi:Lon protease-like protein
VKLPLFPLHAVLFPEATMPLHVFEPRFREMVGRCLEHDEPFGVCLILEGEEVGGSATPHRIGTEAAVIACQRYRDGRYDVVVQGRRRFEVLGLDRSRRFLQAQVRFLNEPMGNLDPGLAEAVARMFERFLESAELAGQAIADETWKAIDPEVLPYRIAAVLPIDDDAKQALLEMPDAAARLRRIAEILMTVTRVESKAGAA